MRIDRRTLLTSSAAVLAGAAIAHAAPPSTAHIPAPAPPSPPSPLRIRHDLVPYMPLARVCVGWVVVGPESFYAAVALYWHGETEPAGDEYARQAEAHVRNCLTGEHREQHLLVSPYQQIHMRAPTRNRDGSLSWEE